MKQSDKKTLDSNIGLVITKKFNRLSYKEKKVLLGRAEGCTLADIGKQFGISRQAVSSIEVIAKAKLKGRYVGNPRVTSRYILDLTDKERQALMRSQAVKKLILGLNDTQSYLRKALVQVLAAILQDEEQLKAVDAYTQTERNKLNEK
jgi:DNA-binding CsgD family transcriptional regulator